jgi:tetratricopeptide (TPR) repeat protein
MASPRRAFISRRPGPLVLKGVFAPTADELLRVFGEQQGTGDLLVSDLSLGAWLGHQSASEISLQLNLTGGDSGQDALRQLQCSTARGVTDHADTIGVVIDVESGGSRIIRDSLLYAQRVIGAVSEGRGRTFLIVMPLAELDWEAENIRFVEFLARGLEETESTLYLVCIDSLPPTLPDGWEVRWSNSPLPRPTARAAGLLTLIPGIISPDVAEALTASADAEDFVTLPLGADCHMIPPECRQKSADVSPFAYDRLAAAAAGRLEWLEAYAQVYGNNIFVRPATLFAAAGSRFVEGGFQIALRLFQRAVSCARTPLERAVAQVRAQSLRISLQWFAEAAEAEVPSAGLPPSLRGALSQYKAWGLVMTGRASEAKEYFEEALLLLKPVGFNREYVYLQNIYALDRLKLGDSDGALAVEQHIEATLTEQPAVDWHLRYINSLNLARLYKRSGNFEQSRRYYQQAFATTLGARSESDRVYVNLCMARLHTEHRRHTQAFTYWLRTGLHWVSSLIPEALAPRVATAILGGRAVKDAELVEEISSVLLGEIALASKLNGLDVKIVQTCPEGRYDVPVFISDEQVGGADISSNIEYALGGPGWGVLMSSVAVTPQYCGPRHAGLRLYLLRLLEVLSQSHLFTLAKTIIVDDRQGHEIPSTFVELVEACVRLAVPAVISERSLHELSAEVRRKLEAESSVRLASSVRSVEFNGGIATVKFKRYFVAKTLSREESKILESLQRRRTILELTEESRVGSLEYTTSLVRSLECSRILNLYLSESTLAQAGIEPTLTGKSHGLRSKD